MRGPGSGSGALLFTSGGIVQYPAFAVIVASAPGANFLNTAETAETDVVVIQATVANTGGWNGRAVRDGAPAATIR